MLIFFEIRAIRFYFFIYLKTDNFFAIFVPIINYSYRVYFNEKIFNYYTIYFVLNRFMPNQLKIMLKVVICLSFFKFNKSFLYLRSENNPKVKRYAYYYYLRATRFSLPLLFFCLVCGKNLDTIFLE
jgi:hypothetical protein